MGADVGSEGTHFVVEEVNAGTHANGFGRTDDGRAFAFRVQRSTLYVKKPVRRAAPGFPRIYYPCCKKSEGGVSLADSLSSKSLIL